MQRVTRPRRGSPYDKRMNSKTPPFMRQAVMDLEESRIREVANAGMGRPDVLAFWFGESDEVTPDIVRQAAIDSMQKGETFYSHNLGLPELRQAVSDYMSALHGQTQAIGVDRLAITSGGVNALMLAAQALIDAGDDNDRVSVDNGYGGEVGNYRVNLGAGDDFFSRGGRATGRRSSRTMPGPSPGSRRRPRSCFVSHYAGPLLTRDVAAALAASPGHGLAAVKAGTISAERARFSADLR